MRPIELRLIAELIKNSRRSDRDLAEALGVSQPTVTRLRTMLEKEGLIEYSAIPDFAKLGFEILAFSLIKRDEKKHPYDLEKAKNSIESRPEFIFVGGGMGGGLDRIAVSVHKNYSEYSEFMKKVNTDWGNFMTMSNFIVDLTSESVVQPLSFKHSADYFLKEAMSMQNNQKRYAPKKEKREKESEKEQKLLDSP